MECLQQRKPDDGFSANTAGSQQAWSSDFNTLCIRFRQLTEYSKIAVDSPRSVSDTITDELNHMSDFRQDDADFGVLEHTDTLCLDALFDETSPFKNQQKETGSTDSENSIFLFELNGLFDESETSNEDQINSANTAIPNSRLNETDIDDCESIFLHELNGLFDDSMSASEKQTNDVLNDDSDETDADSLSSDDLGFGLFDDDEPICEVEKPKLTESVAVPNTVNASDDDTDIIDLFGDDDDDDFLDVDTLKRSGKHCHTINVQAGESTKHSNNSILSVKTNSNDSVNTATYESDKTTSVSKSNSVNTHIAVMEVKQSNKPAVKRSDSEIDWCVICMDGFSNPKILHKCSHKFCEECINEYFKVRPQCPVCFVVYGVITGNQPKDGTMDHSVNSRLKLPGYEKFKTIVIYYSFPDGVQTKEHPNPGQQYWGTSRTAYLPNNDEGQKVLRLLKEAFKRRLVFTVGRSRTTGCDNQVTWNDIHHKTCTNGGQQGFGYPDPTYLNRVQEELAAFGVTEES